MVVVVGVDDGTKNFGVKGESALPSHVGVFGEAKGDAEAGVWGQGARHGVLGEGTGDRGIGVKGKGFDRGIGVKGESDSNTAVFGKSINGYAVYGHSDNNYGVRGDSINDTAMFADSNRGIGLLARSVNHIGLAAYGASYAAYLLGRVFIYGPLEKPGGSFKIDHPLDPVNKYLHHSFVESPDMKNVYDGVVSLDDKGEAEIHLPDWLGALNKDFRYQLTAIGAPGPNLYIAEEISDTTNTTNYGSSSGSSNNNNNNNSRFKIAGGASGMKVSWQVTGIRKDPWANAHRIQVEEEKPDKERGYYLHPDLYGQPEENGISYLIFPKDKREELARAFHK